MASERRSTSLWTNTETLARLDELCQALAVERGAASVSRNEAIWYLLDFRDARLAELRAEVTG